MKVKPEEQEAIYVAIQIGKEFGYGNLIAHLQTAWARTLIDECGFDEYGARVQAGPGYPFAMHEDIIERGEWDETGARYRSKS